MYSMYQINAFGATELNALPLEYQCDYDLPPFFAHGIIRHSPTPGLRLRTA